MLQRKQIGLVQGVEWMAFKDKGVSIPQVPYQRLSSPTNDQTEPAPPGVEVWHLKHWTASTSAHFFNLIALFCPTEDNEIKFSTLPWFKQTLYKFYRHTELKISLKPFFFFFWLPHKACRIFVPWSGTEPRRSSESAESKPRDCRGTSSLSSFYSSKSTLKQRAEMCLQW